MAEAYFADLMMFQAPESCIVNATPPTFAGIAGTTPNTDGSITATWAAGTTASKDPIQYEIYIALGVVTAGVLFVPGNKVTISPSGTTSKKIFTLANQTTYLVKDQQYTMGVRAVDALGYEDSNTAIQTPTAIASGNMPVVLQDIADDLQQDHLDLQADILALEAVSASLAAGAGLGMTLEQPELFMTVTIEEVIP